jgi:hypothetical protein
MGGGTSTSSSPPNPPPTSSDREPLSFRGRGGSSPEEQLREGRSTLSRLGGVGGGTGVASNDDALLPIMDESGFAVGTGANCIKSERRRSLVFTLRE